jgi:hypothetical protein
MAASAPDQPKAHVDRLSLRRIEFSRLIELYVPPSEAFTHYLHIDEASAQIDPKNVIAQSSEPVAEAAGVLNRPWLRFY